MSLNHNYFERATLHNHSRYRSDHHRGPTLNITGRGTPGLASTLLLIAGLFCVAIGCAWWAFGASV